MRTALVAILLTSLPLGWLSVKLQRSRRQRRAAIAVTNAGGSVWFLGPETATGPRWSKGIPPYDSQQPDGKLFEQLVEEATAGDVVAVTLSGGQLGKLFVDSGGRSLPTAGNQPFNLDGQEVAGASTSRWLRYGGDNDYGPFRTQSANELRWRDIQTFENLEVLSMGDRPVGPSILKEIAQLKQLRCLVIYNGKEIDDHCLACVSSLKKLRVLVIDKSRITDDGLSNLSGLTNLEVLELDHSSVQGSGLAHLAPLQNLKLISLRETPLADAGLAQLANHTNSQRLYLFRTQVTDGGLRHLSRLRGLQILHLGKTDVTFEGANSFEKALGRSLIIR